MSSEPELGEKVVLVSWKSPDVEAVMLTVALFVPLIRSESEQVPFRELESIRAWIPPHNMPTNETRMWLAADSVAVKLLEVRVDHLLVLAEALAAANSSGPSVENAPEPTAIDPPPPLVAEMAMELLAVTESVLEVSTVQPVTPAANEHTLLPLAAFFRNLNVLVPVAAFEVRFAEK